MIQVEGEPEFDLTKDFMILNVNQSCVRNNNYIIRINYVGLITEELVGVYFNAYISKGIKN